MSATLPSRRLGDLTVGAVGLGCMGLAMVYGRPARLDGLVAAGNRYPGEASAAGAGGRRDRTAR